MTRRFALAVAALLVLGSASVGLAAVVEDPTGRQMGGENESAPLGGFVSSVLGMEEAAVDATVTVARFETQFSGAETTADRAAVVGSFLNASRMRVAMLERRLDRLEARRMNGSIGEGWFAVEVSWLLSSAENEREVLTRIERAARTVPADALASHDASIERIQRLRARVDRVLTTDDPAIHRTAFDREFYRDVATFVERFNESAGGTGFDALESLSGERVTLSIEPAEGVPTVLSFRSTADVRFRRLRAGERTNATVRMRTDAATARKLLNASAPRRALASAVRNGTVTVRESGS